MKRFLIIISIIATVAALAGAQNRQDAPERIQPNKFAIKKVDFDHVREVTTNPNNAYFYPKLMKAYNSNDTTLSIEGWRNFYYGYTFQEDYNPFRESI